MLISSGPLRYEWIDGWARLPDSDDYRSAWPHHGLVVTRDGDVVTFDPVQPCLLTLDLEGNVLRRSPPLDVEEAHGMTLVEEAGVPYLWLADAQRRRAPDRAYEPAAASERSAVVRVALDGREIQRLPRPEHPAYADGDYRPTMVAVDEQRLGGSGEIWVADGYGSSYVHRFSADGSYRATLSGEEGAGRFKTPHALCIDRRHGEPELYIADRANARIQVYDLDGRFRRVLGEGVLASPTWFASDGDRLFVVEFRPPRLTVLDRDDQLVAYLCEDATAPIPGWPNALDPNGRVTRALPEPGKLNSPHAVAIDRHGDLYLTEWLIGGRFTKLRASKRS